MLTVRLVRNVLTQRLPVSERLVTYVSLVLLVLAVATVWMVLQP